MLHSKDIDQTNSSSNNLRHTKDDFYSNILMEDIKKNDGKKSKKRNYAYLFCCYKYNKYHKDKLQKKRNINKTTKYPLKHITFNYIDNIQNVTGISNETSSNNCSLTSSPLPKADASIKSSRKSDTINNITDAQSKSPDISEDRSRVISKTVENCSGDVNKNICEDIKTVCQVSKNNILSDKLNSNNKSSDELDWNTLDLNASNLIKRTMNKTLEADRIATPVEIIINPHNKVYIHRPPCQICEVEKIRHHKKRKRKKRRKIREMKEKAEAAKEAEKAADKSVDAASSPFFQMSQMFGDSQKATDKLKEERKKKELKAQVQQMNKQNSKDVRDQMESIVRTNKRVTKIIDNLREQFKKQHGDEEDVVLVHCNPPALMGCDPCYDLCGSGSQYIDPCYDPCFDPCLDPCKPYPLAVSCPWYDLGS